MNQLFKTVAATVIFAGWSILSQAQNTFPSTGNVGIGTSTPSKLLQVVSDDPDAIMIYGSKSNGFTASPGITISASGASSAFGMRHNIFPSYGSNRFTIGHISSGDQQLHFFNGRVYFGGYPSNGGGCPDPAQPFSFMANVYAPSIFLGWGNSGSCLYSTTLDGTNISIPYGKITASTGTIANGTITSSLVVGILSGTTPMPTGYKLYVQSGILTEKVKVALISSADWSDYVFSESYKLPSLDEVEKYIQKNHHLPNVPSAEEVVKSGIDVAKMDAKLLEKIEELTLYMIEMKKDYKSLEEKYNQLAAKNK